MVKLSITEIYITFFVVFFRIWNLFELAELEEEVSFGVSYNAAR